MKPYYQDNAVQIFHGDCREILPHLEPVDLVLTDPPYGNGEIMNGGTWGAAKKYSDMREWDKAPHNKFLLWIIKRFGKKAMVWGGNYFKLPASRCWLSWDKLNAVPTMADMELCWTNLDRPSKRFSWAVGCHTSGHPTEKPLPLMTWCLSFVDGIVLDPFMGSGTTLRAAKDLGRKAIGIEIEEKYCEIAARRMSQEVLNLETRE